ncbi:MAG: AAA family ATPase [Peptostreptococcaceae bacterium]|nr:AAA family ATPase [Peptostreptococcaceae bacterium]
MKEKQELIQRTLEYLERKKTTKAQLAIALGYSRTTLSRFLQGSYEGDSSEVEMRLTQYLQQEEEKPKKHTYCKEDFRKQKTFFESRDSKSVLGVCSSCQEDMGLGIIVGKSGFGKTYSLKYYAQMPKVAYLECDDTMSSRDLVEAIERALGIPQSYGTIWKRVGGIREFFRVNSGYLLIIDEADKLISKYTQKKMEILRGIYDQSDVGMVIAGEPKLEAQIKSYLTRFANRVDFYACFQGLTEKEVRSYLSGYEVEEDAMRELIHRANGNQNGCFRLLDRTLSNALRIISCSEQQIITPAIIAQASSMMML